MNITTDSYFQITVYLEILYFIAWFFNIPIFLYTLFRIDSDGFFSNYRITRNSRNIVILSFTCNLLTILNVVSMRDVFLPIAMSSSIIGVIFGLLLNLPLITTIVGIPLWIWVPNKSVLRSDDTSLNLYSNEEE